jgi:hypothetical protein
MIFFVKTILLFSEMITIMEKFINEVIVEKYFKYVFFMKAVKCVTNSNI